MTALAFHPFLRRVSRVAALLTVLAATAANAGAQTAEQLFDDSQVADVHLRLSERDWDRMHQVDDDTYYAADLTWNGVTARNVGIRHRGLGTRTESKPNLLVDVNHYVASQQFLGMTGLILDNAYSDPSLVREAVAMKVFARMGFPAPREAHVRLFVNGAFAGVYVVVERIDRRFVERLYGADEANQESGGYLLEYHWIDEWGFEDLGNALLPYAERFRPQTRETDAAANVWGPVQALVRDLNMVATDRLLETVGTQLDLVYVARYAGVQTCLAERDGLAGFDGVSNFYMYRFRDGRPAVLVPWDADHSFSDASVPVGFRMDTTVLTRRLMEHPRLRDTYYLAIRECAQLLAQPAATDSRGWLEREFSRLFANIAPSVAVDRYGLYHYDDFVLDQPVLLNLARTRPDYLLCQLANPGNGAACPVPGP
jgi:spore coat protein CotH